MLYVGFIGAGGVNFGSAEGPWDHSKRLEAIYQTQSVQVIGIADIDTEKAEVVLKEHRAKCPGLYKLCQVYKDWHDMIRHPKITSVIIGVPPAIHGSLRPGKDMELQCVRLGLDVFAEKPVSAETPPELSRYVAAVEKERLQRRSRAQPGRHPVVQVGYMFRYHPGLDRMREILKRFGRPVLHVNMRYQCAYPRIDATRVFWWDERTSGGPIVEQATHFVDLSRFLVGDMRRGSLDVNAIHGEDPLTELAMIDPGIKVPPEFRNPVLTSAHWRAESGAVVTLVHGICLHHDRYQSELEVWCDGLKMRLSEPYDRFCELRVRESSMKPGVPCKEYTFRFDTTKSTEDPYFQELFAFLKASACQSNEEASKYVRSSFPDAANTYKLTWDIKSVSRNPKPKL